MPLSHLIVHLEVSPEGNKNLNKYSVLAGVRTTQIITALHLLLDQNQ